MQTLSKTVFEFMYTVFGVSSDKELCMRMANIGLIYTGVVGVYSLFQPAPYGRYQRDTFGPTINAKLGWMVQEAMSFLCPIAIILLTPSLQLKNFANIVPLVLFEVHYFHRSFIFPLILPSNSKPVPLLTALSALMFTTYNGFLQGMHLVNVVDIHDSFHGLLGTSIFLVGMGINITHDRMLLALRKKAGVESEEGSSQREYKIPRGGLFEYVSGANYFGEIVEWMGFGLITMKYPQVVFAVFTATFLGLRAIYHHRFYKEKFGATYPASRSAIIPFIL